jgi:hypothetical protein
VPWEVIIGDEVGEWLDGIDEGTYELIIAALNVLEREGPSLGRPLVDTIKGTDIKNMKELRPGSRSRSAVRILFAFDPARRAILLVAGDKAGNWTKWYTKNIPIAEARWETHLKAMKK